MSSTLDVSALRVAELRKELRSRGLSAQGDKAELASRLRAALSIDDLDLTALDEETDAALPLAASPPCLASPTSPLAPEPPPAPEVAAEPPPRPAAKKIVLNRAPVAPPSDAAPASAPAEERDEPAEPKRARITVDPKNRLEMRAKRFGLPLGDDALKEARKARFGGGAAVEPPKRAAVERAPPAPPASAASLQVLKRRAERFGCSVSKVMVDAENKEKLERRKAKFGVVES